MNATLRVQTRSLRTSIAFAGFVTESIRYRAGVEADLVTLAPIQSLRDVIANQPIPFTGRTAKLTVPAGAFRIVDVTLTQAANQ